MVGTDGSVSERCSDVTAIGRMRPVATYGEQSSTLPISMLVWPPSTAVVAGAPPP